MKVGLLLLTHNDIGSQLLLAAKSIFGDIPSRVELLSVDHYDQPNDVIHLAKQYVKVLDEGKGVLILTDMFGSTPSNIASEFSNIKNVEVVSGINLSMLLNVFNYPNLSIGALTKKALDGGKQGIVKINDERKSI
ncbi:MAG: PTS fructose transporter subunit IIA [Pseudomonadota bacterium]|nr:PTS fructose transporter subunit IIA [Pseudomonadota bacterium]